LESPSRMVASLTPSGPRPIAPMTSRVPMLGKPAATKAELRTALIDP